MLNKFKEKLNNDIHFKEILNGSVYTFVLKISGIIFSYFVILIISRQYGAEGVGIYNLTFSIMTFLSIIATMGINISILRYVGQFNKNKEIHKLKYLYHYALELVIPFSLLLAVVLFYYSDFIAENVLNNHIYNSILKFCAIIIPFLAINNISIEFIRGLKQLKISEYLRSVNQPIINIILLILLGINIIDKLVPVYILGVGILINSIAAVMFIRNKLNKITIINNIKFSKKELISTSLPMMVVSISSFVMGNITLYLLEIYYTSYEVGVYSVVLKITAMISLILIVVNTISAPKFSELYWNGNFYELQTVLDYSSKIIFLFSISLAILLIIFSKEILSIFGEEYISGEYALYILIIGQLINSITGSVSIFLNMTGHQTVLRNIILISTIITIPMSYVLTLLYGINGAAISFVIGMSLLNIVAVIYVRLKMNFITYYAPFSKNHKEIFGEKYEKTT